MNKLIFLISVSYLAGACNQPTASSDNQRGAVSDALEMQGVLFSEIKAAR
jgi:hypothetical protein